MSIIACSVPDCEKPTGIKGTARGLCSKHYNRWRRNGDPLVRTLRKIVTDCSVDGCGKPHDALTFCSAHLTNLRRHGTPTPRKRGEIVDGKKICPSCDSDLPLSEYMKRGSSVASNCKPCYRAYRIERYQANHDESKRVGRESAARHPERRRDASRKRRAVKRSVTVEDVSSLLVFERDSWTCGVCNTSIPRVTKWPHPLSPSLDHVVALASGGHHSYANTQASHLVCNMRKGANAA